MSLGLLVCCETPIMCAGLKALLEPKVDVEIDTETTSRGAIARAKAESPGVTLVVAPLLTLEDRTELGLLAALSKVVLVAKAENTHRSVEGLRIGLRAVLPPDCSADELVHVVTMVMAGDTMVMPGSALGGLGQVRDEGPSELASRMAGVLTAREKEVLFLLVRGSSNVEIAEKLSVSMPTVRSHVHHLLRKLGVGSRGQAIAIAYETGLVNAIKN
jgi:DNA-binding NarL/FixJ family response regulator